LNIPEEAIEAALAVVDRHAGREHATDGKVATALREALGAAAPLIAARGVKINDPESIARAFHEAYERLAPSFGYETRKASAVAWEQVPDNNRALMTAVAAEVAPLIAAQVLRDAADLVDRGPTFPLSPSIISALLRERADDHAPGRSLTEDAP